MKLPRSANRAAAWYVIASIFIGPGLILLVASFSPGPIGDCRDEAWLKAGYRMPIEISSVVHHYDKIIQGCEGVMLVIGAVILGLLIAKGRRTPVLLFLAVPFVMACYALTIWFFSGAPCG